MHMIGWIGLFAVGMATVTSVAFAIYSALPEAALNYAERHGRFQGLAQEQILAGGTRVGEPPVRPRFVLDRQSA